MPFFFIRNVQFLCIVGIFGDFPLGLINVMPSEGFKERMSFANPCAFVSLLGLGFINEQFHVL